MKLFFLLLIFCSSIFGELLISPDTIVFNYNGLKPWLINQSSDTITFESLHVYSKDTPPWSTYYFSYSDGSENGSMTLHSEFDLFTKNTPYDIRLVADAPIEKFSLESHLSLITIPPQDSVSITLGTDPCPVCKVAAGNKIDYVYSLEFTFYHQNDFKKIVAHHNGLEYVVSIQPSLKRELHEKSKHYNVLGQAFHQEKYMPYVNYNKD